MKSSAALAASTLCVSVAGLLGFAAPALAGAAGYGGGGGGGGGGAAVASPVDAPAHVFLCYSSFQVTPDTQDGWTTAAAPGLLAQGYWQPWAIPGADASPGAENVGGVDGSPVYHLVCNLDRAQAGQGAYTDDDGDSIPADLAGTPGIFEVAR